MNIFYLDHDPRLAAQYHCDKHVVKMILESAQLLCTAVNIRAGGQVSPYKTTHVNHPCSIWVRQNSANAMWVWYLLCYLNAEYSFRYGKEHLAYTKLRKAGMLKLILQHLPSGMLTTPAVAMPDEYKTDSVVKSYRNYYRQGKKHLHNWTKRGAPSWL